MITILVPVYAGLADTQRCLESVARHAGSTRTRFDVLVIDDGSPDTGLVRWIEAFAADTTAFDVEVLHNERNLGFVKTCNRGLRATSGDVVILNADTIVTNGWGLLELRPSRMSLEEIFLSLTTEEVAEKTEEPPNE